MTEFSFLLNILIAWGAVASLYYMIKISKKTEEKEMLTLDLLKSMSDKILKLEEEIAILKKDIKIDL